MLAAVLAGHEAARFTRHLVREQRLAVNAAASYDSTARGPGIFHLYGSPSEGRTRAEVEAGLRAEIAAVQEQGVAPDELARAKAQLIAGQIYKLDSMFAQAMEIGQLESAGIPHTRNRRMIDRLQAVTAEQIQAVARKYFGDEQLTVAELDPQPLPPAPRPRSPLASRH
jgi:zinc protease